MAACIMADVQWQDRKRYYGLPLSFEVYALSRDRLSVTCGFLRQSCREFLLYRIRDISLSRSLVQWVFGVGSLRITISDGRVITLENIRHPFLVKELLHQNVEQEKERRRFWRPIPDIWYDF